MSPPHIFVSSSSSSVFYSSSSFSPFSSSSSYFSYFFFFFFFSFFFFFLQVFSNHNHSPTPFMFAPNLFPDALVRAAQPLWPGRPQPPPRRRRWPLRSPLRSATIRGNPCNFQYLICCFRTCWGDSLYGAGSRQFPRYINQL